MEDDGIFRAISNTVKAVTKTADCFPADESSVNTIIAIELWLDQATNQLECRRVQESDPSRWETWAETRVERDGSRIIKSLVFRLVWTLGDFKRAGVNLSQPLRQFLFNKFGVKTAYGYANTFFSGVTAIPGNTHPDPDHYWRTSYVFGYQPKLGAVWSHTTPMQHVTDGGFTECILIRVVGSSISQQECVKESVKGFTRMLGLLQDDSWNPQLCRSALFPALLLSLQLGLEMDSAMRDIGEKIRKTEGKTGHHDYEHRDTPSDAPDAPPGHRALGKQKKDVERETLAELASKTPGHATRLASVRRKSKMVEELIRFAKSPEHRDDALVRFNMDVMERRLHMQKMEAEHLQERVDIQIQAVFHLISKNDYMDNLEVAHANKNISESMKALAVVTMFFLPGSFVSALLSTDCFGWDNRRPDLGVQVPIEPQFWLYWILTIPLTLLTFVFYLAWLWVQHRQESGSKGKGNKTGETGSSFKMRLGTPLENAMRQLTGSSKSGVRPRKKMDMDELDV